MAFDIIEREYFENVILAFTEKLEETFPGWRFRVGVERSAEGTQTVLLVQYTRGVLFERMSRDPKVELFPYEVKASDDAIKQLHDKVITRLMFLGLKND